MRVKVVKEEPYYDGSGRMWVTLSCGHGYDVSMYGRYAHCKTMTCNKHPERKQS